MASLNSNTPKEQSKTSNTFDFFFEILGWLRIAASPTLFGLALGIFFYFLDTTQRGLIVCIALAFIGLIVGTFWATKHWKGKGTDRFMSRNYSTPIFEDDKELR